MRCCKIMTQQLWRAGSKTACLLLILLLLGGCTPEKARTIRLAAEQFSSQALIAVNALEKTMKAELRPSQRSPREQTEDFVAFLAGLDLDRLRKAGIELGFSNLEQAADPELIRLDLAVRKARERYLQDLRTRCTAFAGTLQGLEQGSFFAADAVKGAARIAGRLIADMAGIARHFTAHPPRLLQERGSLVADTLDILENGNLSQSSEQDRLAAIKVRFDAVKSAEQELLRDVLESSLKAVVMGRTVLNLAAEYDTLPVKKMQDLLLQTIRIVGGLSGRELQTLANRADIVFAEISLDPELKNAARQAVRELKHTLIP